MNDNVFAIKPVRNELMESKKRKKSGEKEKTSTPQKINSLSNKTTPRISTTSFTNKLIKESSKKINNDYFSLRKDVALHDWEK